MLSALAHRMLLNYFGDQTFTIELPDKPERAELEREDIIQKHPAGPLGSRSSYYRTEKGWTLWNQLTNQDKREK